MKRRDNYKAEGSRKRTRISGGDGRNASVFVGQLSSRTSWQDLKDHMRRAGNVDRVSAIAVHSTFLAPLLNYFIYLFQLSISSITGKYP